MRRPTLVELGLALALVLTLGALWRTTRPAPVPAPFPPTLAGRTTSDPAIALLTDEGLSLYAARAFPQACQRLADAFDRDPGSAVLQENVARCFAGWGWQTLRAGRPDEAMVLFRQALRQAPDGEDLLAGLGVAAVHAGRTDVAIEALEGAARAGHDPDVALLLARLYDQRDDAERAVTHLRRLVADEPGNAEAQRLLDKLERERAVELAFHKDETAHFVLKWSGGRDAETRQALLEALERLYEVIGGRLDHRPAAKVVVILYPEGRFQQLTGTHDWVSGLFDGKIRLADAAYAGGTPQLERLLAHELTHAIVHQLSRGHAPRWLQEGLAQHFEGLPDDPFLELPRGLTLRGLEALLTDGDPAKARTGYRTALWLVRDLLERGGTETMADLLARLGRGETVVGAVPLVYGLPLSELEAQWRRVLGG